MGLFNRKIKETAETITNVVKDKAKEEIPKIVKKNVSDTAETISAVAKAVMFIINIKF